MSVLPHCSRLHPLFSGNGAVARGKVSAKFAVAREVARGAEEALVVVGDFFRVNDWLTD